MCVLCANLWSWESEWICIYVCLLHFIYNISIVGYYFTTYLSIKTICTGALPTWISVHQVLHVVPTEAIKIQFPCRWSYRQLWAPVWVLESELTFSARTTSTPNSWTTSSVLDWLFDCFVRYTPDLQKVCDILICDTVECSVSTCEWVMLRLSIFQTGWHTCWWYKHFIKSRQQLPFALFWWSCFRK